MNNQEMLYCGVKVQVSDWVLDTPKFQLSKKMQDILGPEKVVDFNVWSRAFFGTSPVFMCFEGNVFCSPKGFEILKQVASDKIEYVEMTPLSTGITERVVSHKPRSPSISILRGLSEGLYLEFGDRPYYRNLRP